MDLPNLIILSSITLKVVTLAILLKSVLPRQLQELTSGGGNGLKLLRRFMFAFGAVLLISTIVAIAIASCISTIIFPECGSNGTLISIASFTNSIINLSAVLVLYLIYNSKYTKHVGDS